jgi:ubiquinone/menaquinone biosynthesis C-methylase UbiE
VPNTIKHDILKGLPFPDKSFESITCFEIFEHIPPEKRDFVVSEIKRVCRKRVIISVPSKDKINWDSDLDQPYPHQQHLDWLFDSNSAMELAKKFSDRFGIYIIENPCYVGYGIVVDLI